jgi:hypothetical protein
VTHFEIPGGSFSRWAAPRRRPSDCAALSLPESPMSWCIWPLRIFATRIALATVSAGRFWASGPLDIKRVGYAPVLFLKLLLGGVLIVAAAADELQKERPKMELRKFTYVQPVRPARRLRLPITVSRSARRRTRFCCRMRNGTNSSGSSRLASSARSDARSDFKLSHYLRIASHVRSG